MLTSHSRWSADQIALRPDEVRPGRPQSGLRIWIVKQLPLEIIQGGVQSNCDARDEQCCVGTHGTIMTITFRISRNSSSLGDKAFFDIPMRDLTVGHVASARSTLVSSSRVSDHMRLSLFSQS